MTDAIPTTFDAPAEPIVLDVPAVFDGEPPATPTTDTADVATDAAPARPADPALATLDQVTKRFTRLRSTAPTLPTIGPGITVHLGDGQSFMLARLDGSPTPDLNPNQAAIALAYIVTAHAELQRSANTPTPTTAAAH